MALVPAVPTETLAEGVLGLHTDLNLTAQSVQAGLTASRCSWTVGRS
jgi:hypothetical protein